MCRDTRTHTAKPALPLVGASCAVGWADPQLLSWDLQLRERATKEPGAQVKTPTTVLKQ